MMRLFLITVVLILAAKCMAFDSSDWDNTEWMILQREALNDRQMREMMEDQERAELESRLERLERNLESQRQMQDGSYRKGSNICYEYGLQC